MPVITLQAGDATAQFNDEEGLTTMIPPAPAPAPAYSNGVKSSTTGATTNTADEDEDDVEEALPPDEDVVMLKSGHATADEDNDKEDENGFMTSAKFACLSITSHGLFVLASSLYVVLAKDELDYYRIAQTIPDYVWEADDWYTWYPYLTDDYLFQVGPNDGGWVSRYQSIYFGAAFCFVLVGLLEFLKHPKSILAILFFVAGWCGVASSMLVNSRPHASSIMNSISVHLYAVEAILLLIRRPFYGTLKWTYRLADAFFVCGTILDVVLSYFTVQGTTTLIHAKVAVAGSSFWLLCGLLYLYATLRIYATSLWCCRAMKTKKQRRVSNNNKLSFFFQPIPQEEVNHSSTVF